MLRNSSGVTSESLKPGLHEGVLTRRLETLLAEIADGSLLADLAELRDAEASDRVSRHVAGMLARAIEQAPEGKRSEEAVRIAVALIRNLQSFSTGTHDLSGDECPDGWLAGLVREHGRVEQRRKRALN